MNRIVEKDKTVIPVVFSANNQFVYYCYVTIYSMLKHASTEFQYSVYVFQTGMSKENKKLLESLSCSYAEIECLDISEEVEAFDLRNIRHLSVETYFRLFISRILPQYKKILYLDSDMCILSDISKLYCTDIGDYAVGAAHDVKCKELKKHSIEIGNLDFRATFNAGVLLIDTDNFEEQEIREKCLSLLAEDYERKKRKLIYADQDALNLSLRDNFYVLEQKWNYQPQYLWKMDELVDDARDQYLEDKNHACVTHYSGEKKPWKFPELPMSDVFWRYAKETSVFMKMIMSIMAEVREKEGRLDCFKTYRFPYESVPFGSRIVLYAAGAVGMAFYNQIQATGYAKIVSWTDKDFGKFSGQYGVQSLETAVCTDFDYIIIAMEKKEIADKVAEIFAQMDIPKRKIIWSEYRIG